MMKRIIVCSKEEPLHVQLNGIDIKEIEELKISGFLGEEDFSLLTEMSQEGGKAAYTGSECCY